MLFNLLALALHFAKPEHLHIPGGPQVLGIHGCMCFWLASSWTLHLPNPLWVGPPRECYKEFMLSSWGTGMLTQGERTAGQHTYVHH